jgi:hypothetical protein
MKPTKKFAVSATVLALAFHAHSASSFQPLVTDDTGTQGSGGNQIELSINADRTEVAGATEHRRTLPVAYTRGLNEVLDIFAGISHAQIRPSGGEASGNGNPVLGVKWRFYENEKSGTSIAAKPELLFPVSAGRENAGLGKGRTSGNLTLILTQEIPFGAIHFNAGLGRDRYRDRLSNPDAASTRASIAPVWYLTTQWKLALDLGTTSVHAGGAKVRSNFAELGAIYSPSRDLDFALGILRASDNDSPGTTTHTATAGLTLRYR